MIPPAFEYERVSSLGEAIAKLSAHGAAAKVLAGGHSLIPLMKLRLASPAVLIDIARIPGLAGIRDVDGAIAIGAATTHQAIATSGLLHERCRVVAEAAATIGDAQVRNRGTIGGSLAHGDPSADYPAVMLALDADVHLQGPRGLRIVRAADFFTGLFSVDLAPDELITEVRVAPARAAAYAKLYQRASHFAIVGVAAAIDVDGDRITRARIGLTGATSCPRRLGPVESSLAGRRLEPAAIEAAAAQAADGLDDIASDLHASDDYRRAMVQVFTRRALMAAAGRVSA